MDKEHLPVMKEEVIAYLGPRRNENFIDCTIGLGGYALEILKRNGPEGKILGIEIDPVLYKKLKEKEIERLILFNGSYSCLKEIVAKTKFKEISGILYDFGLSSWHLEKSGRGFSFKREEPLIMRYDWRGSGLTAEEILNSWPEEKIEKILKEYGQERFSKKIAKEIVRKRKIKKIEKTTELVEIIKKSVPVWYRKRKIHFATKTFQALRIAVNKELENIKISLPQALEVLKKGGRLVAISFHSLEDRIVKLFFNEKEKEGKLKILTRKPILPTREEIKINPRSRSSKLRAAIKI